MAEFERIKLETYIAEHMRTDGSGKRDLCPIYRDRGAMDEIIAYLTAPYRGIVDYVAAPESLGFILGGMVSSSMGIGFIPIRNGSISSLEDHDAIRASYIDHRDCARSLHLRKSNFPEGSNILLVDDWVGTAATVQACATIIEETQGHLAGIIALGADYNAATQNMIDEGKLRSVIVNKD